MTDEVVIDIQGLVTQFPDGSRVHDNLNLKVLRGQVLGIVGGSGTGKTTLLREILLLHRATSGSIRVFGIDILACSLQQQQMLRQRWGMMFQSGALFSGLTVLENISFPLHEFTHLPPKAIKELAYVKLALAQYPFDSANKYPAELSGGMIKRAAVARALAMDPELLFLDEPTAGLDPETASALDELILNLKQTLGLTIVVVTHDLDTLWATTDTVAFLGEKKVLANEPMKILVKNSQPLIKAYFSNQRAIRAEPAGVVD